MTKQRTVWDEQVEGFLEAYEKTFVSMTDEWGQLSPRVSNATKAVMVESILNGGLVSPSAKIFLTDPTAVFSYTRDDGFTVTCHGEIGETPQLRIILSDSPDIHIQMGVTYLDKGQTLKTWRAWTKFLNKHSQYASRITRIESTNRSLKTTNSEK